MPGTGKTACVKTVINIIESELLQNNKKLLKKNSKINIFRLLLNYLYVGLNFLLFQMYLKLFINLFFLIEKDNQIKNIHNY